VIRRSSVEPVEFIELFKTADFVSIHIPLNAGTKNLVGERELNSMKESAFLISTSIKPTCTYPEKELDFLFLFAICYYMVK